MCTLITMAEDQPAPAIWDPDEITITVQRGTHPHYLIRELHALLADLGAPPSTGTLRCFCGDPITLPPEAMAPPAARPSL